MYFTSSRVIAHALAPQYPSSSSSSSSPTLLSASILIAALIISVRVESFCFTRVSHASPLEQTFCHQSEPLKIIERITKESSSGIIVTNIERSQIPQLLHDYES
ncbi:hypothetical protein QL285_059362 [Trifolium repens]|nr:hypothetical protein QL285_059362 [Trifolium repens]